MSGGFESHVEGGLKIYKLSWNSFDMKNLKTIDWNLYPWQKAMRNQDVSIIVTLSEMVWNIKYMRMKHVLVESFTDYVKTNNSWFRVQNIFRFQKNNF